VGLTRRDRISLVTARGNKSEQARRDRRSAFAGGDTHTLGEVLIPAIRARRHTDHVERRQARSRNRPGRATREAARASARDRREDGGVDPRLRHHALLHKAQDFSAIPIGGSLVVEAPQSVTASGIVDLGAVVEASPACLGPQVTPTPPVTAEVIAAGVRSMAKGHGISVSSVMKAIGF
jgi:hypothetical protein